MTDPIALSFARQLHEFAEAWERAWSATSPEAAFSRWATRVSGLEMPFVPPDSDEWVALPQGRWFEAPILAAAGYELALGHSQLIDRWLAGMGRLIQRPPFPVDRQSFFFRPMELLGLALGAQAMQQRDGSLLEWLGEVLGRGEHMLPADAVTQVAAVRVRAATRGNREWQPAAVPEAWIDVAHLLWASASIPAVPWLASPVSEIERDFLRRALVEDVHVEGAAQACTAWVSLRLAVTHAVDATIASMSAGDVLRGVVRLCRRLPLLVHEMQRRHAGRTALTVENEYDVQDLLRGVLNLHFDDVRPEEWTPSYGGVSARMDFLLKPERIVIEAKMTRDRLGQKEVVQQLAVDKEHYRAHPDCDRLVCFIYDPERRLTNPVALEHDLSAEGLLPTTVVVAPRGI